MANSFVNFLNEALYAAGNLRDFQHASRLYVTNNYELTPKAGWLYYVVLNINPALAGAIADPTAQAEFAVLMNRYKSTIGLLAKEVDQPKFSIETETLNQYNKKTVIQKKINYNPMTITFHDDMANVTTNLWKSYYQYYYADSITGGTNRVPTSIPQKYIDNKYIDYTVNQYGLDNYQSVPFFVSIDIYQLNKQKYTMFKIVNPMIKEWTHDQLDQTQGNRLLTSKMTVDYETVIYDTNPLNRTSLQNPGFANDHYDRTPSPLSIRGQGTTSIFGPGGTVAGAVDIFGDLQNIGSASPLDLMNTAIKSANLIKNAKNLSKAGIKEESSTILRDVLGNISSTPSAVRTADGSVVNVPAAERISQGPVNATQQVSNPVGLSLPSIAKSNKNTPTTATPKQGL